MPETFETWVIAITFVFAPRASMKGAARSSAPAGAFGTDTRRTVKP